MIQLGVRAGRASGDMTDPAAAGKSCCGGHEAPATATSKSFTPHRGVSSTNRASDDLDDREKPPAKNLLGDASAGGGAPSGRRWVAQNHPSRSAVITQDFYPCPSCDKKVISLSLLI